MSTLRQIAALHIDKWSGGQQGVDSPLYYRTTILKIRGLLNTLLRVQTLQARNEGDKSGSAICLASYDLAVAKAGGVAKATLPQFPLDLPFNGGIHRVFPKDRLQGGFDFVRTYNPGVSAHTDAGNYAGYKYYWEQGKDLCFKGAYSEPDEDMNVTVQMFVAAPDTIGENDLLPISPDMQTEVLRLLDQIHMPPVAVDKVNNNNPQT